MKHSNFLIQVSLMFAVISCKPEPVIPDQNKIYASYRLNYNKTELKTTAEATFYLNEPSTINQQKLELNHPANVSYAGDQLVFNTTGRIYRKEFIGQIPGQFVYTNYNEQVYTNAAAILDTVSITVSSDSANQQLDYYFEINGPPLDNSEVIDVLVKSLVSEQEFGFTFETLSGLIIQVTTTQLQTLGVGNLLIRATRRQENGIEQGSPAGGKMTLEYAVQDTVVIY